MCALTRRAAVIAVLLAAATASLAQTPGRAKPTTYPKPYRVWAIKGAWYAPLTRDDMLVAYGDKARQYVFRGVNIQTGHWRPVPELSRWLLLYNHTRFEVSPDGNHASWADVDGERFACTLDGSMKRYTWIEIGYLFDGTIWDAGSQCVVSPSSYHPEAEKRQKVAVYAFGSRKARTVLLPGRSLDGWVCPADRATFWSCGGAGEGADELTIFTTRLLPTVRVTKRPVSLPKDASKLITVDYSPRDRQAVWTFEVEPTSKSRLRRCFWVSDANGQHSSHCSSLGARLSIRKARRGGRRGAERSSTSGTVACGACP